jgi:hypothetical protein
VFLVPVTLAGCGGSDGGGGSSCVPGQVVACPCPGRGDGTQVCRADGTFGACACGDGATADSAPPAPDGAQAMDAAADAASTSDAARSMDAVALPDAAPPMPDAQAPDADPLAGHVYVAARFDGASSVWATLPGAMGRLGLEAGHAQCVFLGADHVCDYVELRAAEAKGELASIPQGTTAWVQRTTPEIVNGAESPPGPGGNCNDWTFAGNHVSDGEYVSFDAEGVPTWHLDGDTFYDGIDTTHAIPGDLDCGGATRSIFCCSALP